MTTPRNAATARPRKQLSKIWQLREQRAAAEAMQRQRDIKFAQNKLELIHARSDALGDLAGQQMRLLENDLHFGMQAWSLRARHEHLAALLASRAAVHTSLVMTQSTLAKQLHELTDAQCQQRKLLLKQHFVVSGDW